MSRPETLAARRAQVPARDPALTIYLIFVVSWFLHLGARVPLLGAVRFDLLLVVILTCLALSRGLIMEMGGTRIGRLLAILLAYALITVPFVQWPGSVIKYGLPEWIKAAVFFFFMVAFVRTEADLRRFIVVFTVCQTVRVLEPLYLNLTQGYWGSAASMRYGGEFLYRLAGGPHDVVNPNGLAYIVCTVVPFLYFFAGLSWKHRLAFLVVTPACLYALLLTGSRSGLIGMGIVAFGIWLKSRRRVLLAVLFVIAAGVGFSMLSPDMQDRYLSIIGMGEKNEATASERFEGMRAQLTVVAHRPLFGHGLGTSAEANYHFSSTGPYAGMAIKAHNLYLEVAQELGLIGLVIFLVFMKSIFAGFFESRRALRATDASGFLPRLIDAMQVWLAMNFVFSFASYGLSTPDWYLAGGISVVILRLAREMTAGRKEEAAGPARRATGVARTGGVGRLPGRIGA